MASAWPAALRPERIHDFPRDSHFQPGRRPSEQRLSTFFVWLLYDSSPRFLPQKGVIFRTTWRETVLLAEGG